MNRRSEAWGQFLSQFPWDWFVTLTFREPVPSFRAYRMFRRFTADIERAAGMPIAWFLVFEYGARTGRLHVHALMLNVAHLSRLWWLDEWNRRAGYARILPFDRSRGAAFYCAKYLTKGSGEWEIVGLPAIVQPSLPLLPQKSATWHNAIGDGRIRVAGSMESTPEPTVRRRRPEKLYSHRRDWEAEMLRNGARWREPDHQGAHPTKHAFR